MAATTPPAGEPVMAAPVTAAKGMGSSKQSEAQYRVNLFGNGAEVPESATTTVDASSRKSNWLQRLGWLDTPSLTLGTRVWFSQGRSAFDFAGSGGSPDVLSELRWQGQNTKIYEVSADLVVRRFVANVALGWGHIQHGTLRDQDFNGNSRTGIFSDTLSPQTDGFVVYGSVDIGPRLIAWSTRGGPGAVDFLVGFQYWRENWTARGSQAVLAGSFVSDANAITETVTWKSIRLGPRLTIPIIPRVTAVGQFFYIPWTQYENDDIHLLRGDLAQDPSGILRASGGEGIQMEAALRVRVWKALMIEGGYRYWDLRSGVGTKETFVNCIFPDGSIRGCDAGNVTLNEAKARRQGLFFGVDWTF